MDHPRVARVALLGAALAAAAGAAAAEAPANAYVGAGKCRLCHNAPATGSQYDIWAKTAHARAYHTLGTPEAKATAAARGIDDPQKAAACLKCHVTGYDAPAALLKEKYTAREGVSCESCHGPGSAYWPLNVMKDRAKAVAAGLWIPDEKTCVKCHNPESPQYKPFDYQAALSRITHRNPKTAR